MPRFFCLRPSVFAPEMVLEVRGEGSERVDNCFFISLLLLFYRCADAAVSPVASCQADGRRSPAAAADPLDIIPSSQGSPVTSPPKPLPAWFGDSKNHSEPQGNVALATPASEVKSASNESLKC